MSVQVWIPQEIISALKRYGVEDYKRTIQAIVSSFVGALTELQEDEAKAILQKLQQLGQIYMVFYHDSNMRPYKVVVKK